jgi:DNA-binding transcriptional MerR regulator
MARVAEKSANAFRTIGEAAEVIGVPQHVLRFWETRFPELQPMKRGGGRRYYRPADMTLLETIRSLLHDQGMTIRGAQQLIAASKGGEIVPAMPVAVADALASAPVAEPAEKAAPRLALVSAEGRAVLLDVRARLAAALAA